MIKILIGNKADLTADRKVSREQAEYWAKERNMMYFEVNSLDVNSVNEAFYQTVETICANIDSDYYPKNGRFIKESTGILTKGDLEKINSGGRREGAIPEVSQPPQRQANPGMAAIAEGEEDDEDELPSR